MGTLSHVSLVALAKAKKLGKHSDGDGLYLRITETSCLWQMKYRFGGKEKMLSFGKYPEVPLAEARRKTIEARALLRDAICPSAARREAKFELKMAEGNSFAAVAQEWYRVRSKGWVEDSGKRTWRRLEKYVFPFIGQRMINQISKPEMVLLLRRIEATGKLETASRTAQACSAVFRFGIHEGRLDQDPCWKIQEVLLKPDPGHMAALLKPAALAEFLRCSYDYDGRGPTVRAALKLLPLLLLRPGELRQGEWIEIDFDKGEWLIPAGRMKQSKKAKEQGEAHVVPLSKQALGMLKALKEITGRGRYIFPGQRSGRPMSDGGLNAAFRSMGYNTSKDVTPHGFRATARTLGEELLKERPQVIEAQLAHTVKDALGRSYNRTEFLTARREFMQRWADLLDSLRLGLPSPSA